MTVSEAIPKRTLQTAGGRSVEFTALGFGAAPLGNYRVALSEDACDETVNAAWDAGLRYFDTAPLYGFGLSEQRVGRNLTHRPRQEFTLSTKVGRLLEPVPPEEADGIIFEDIPPFKFVYDYSYDGVMRSIEESRKRSGIERFEILYVHDIDSFNHGGRDQAEAAARTLIDKGGWRALDELRNAGIVDAIGVGVNEWEPCALMLEFADPDIFLLAGRYTLLEQEPLVTLFPQCEARGVGIVIGGPYNSGLLAGGDTYNYGEIPTDISERTRAIAAVCDAHGVSMPAAALKFVLAHPLVVSVIPGSQTVGELEQNVALVGEKIPAAFWEEMRAKHLLAASAPVPD